jgi:hypothetical protein
MPACVGGLWWVALSSSSSALVQLWQLAGMHVGVCRACRPGRRVPDAAARVEGAGVCIMMSALCPCALRAAVGVLSMAAVQTLCGGARCIFREVFAWREATYACPQPCMLSVAACCSGKAAC